MIRAANSTIESRSSLADSSRSLILGDHLVLVLLLGQY